MDRTIEPSQHKKRLRRRVFAVAAAIATAWLGLSALRAFIEPSVDRDEIRTASVSRGDVAATVSAAGLVVPKREQIISALFPTEVVDVVAPPGTEVEEGDPILVLDGRSLELEIASLEERLAIEATERDRERLRLERVTSEGDARRELLEIDLELREARVERFRRLSEDGLISGGERFEAELDVKRTRAELDQLVRIQGIEEATASAELERIDLETAILERDLEDLRRQRQLATVRAPRRGVVTWAIEEVGASVVAGMPLARVADLSSFRVEAQISDFYAARLAEGLPAEVVVGDVPLSARVGGILPTVDGGTMTLLVELEAPEHPTLRPQLRVDVEVITGAASDALGLKNGPSIGTGSQDVFVIVDGMAERRRARFGLSSRDRIEVVEGLAEGDEVIISDVRDWQHLDSFRVE